MRGVRRVHPTTRPASGGRPLPTRGRGTAAPHHLPLRHRRLSGLRIVLHPPAAGRVEAAERKFDDAFVGVRGAFDHGPIGLVDGAGLEQPAELGQRLAVAAEHQAAGGVAVEPVRQRRRPRQPEAQRVEMIFQAFAAFGAAMHGEARRLVDHQHQPVAVEQPRHHLFRGHGCLPWRNRYHGRGNSDSVTENERQHGRNESQLVAAPHRRAQAHVLGARRRHFRSRYQAQARCRDDRRDRGRADPRRSRPRYRGPYRRRARATAATTAGISPDEVKAVVAAEIEKVLAPVAQPLDDRCGEQSRSSFSSPASTAPARPRPSASLRQSSAPKAAPSCWRPATRSAPPPSISSKSGASAPARR